MSSLAIITARGGSKRIKNKNIKSFCGKPIISYSINAAIGTNLFDKVMVSTDSDEIAEVAKKYGAEIPFMRSKKNSDDFATTSDVIVEVLHKYMEMGYTFKTICCIYPTAPFVTAEKLRYAMNFLETHNQYDSVVPVVRYSFPPQRAFRIINKEVNIIFPDTFQNRSQDFEPIYHDCGQFYCLNTEEFLINKRLVLEHTYPLVYPEIEVQDIDTIEDWNIAEIKYEIMLRRLKDSI